MAQDESLQYQNTQMGYVTGGSGLAALLIMYAGFRDDRDTLGPWGLALLGGFGLLTVLFSSLTVEVTDQVLRFYFGPGFWKRQFPLSDIRSVKTVRNAVYHGWGIRHTMLGWLYNVSGLRAVELEIEGEGTIRIGSDEPEQLKRALEDALQRTS